MAQPGVREDDNEDQDADVPWPSSGRAGAKEPDNANEPVRRGLKMSQHWLSLYGLDQCVIMTKMATNECYGSHRWASSVPDQHCTHFIIRGGLRRNMSPCRRSCVPRGRPSSCPGLMAAGRDERPGRDQSHAGSSSGHHCQVGEAS
jgi:hypothetical protein